MPDRWSLADIIRSGRDGLIEIAGVDFGYDPAAWHAHLVATNACGYTWSNKHLGFPRQIAESIANPEWQAAVACLLREQQPSGDSS